VAKYKVFDWLCSDCHHKEEVLVDTSQLNWDAPRSCSACGTGEATRCPSSPTVQKASFVDGTKRAGLEDIKAVAKLEVAKANSRPEQRNEIQKEINNRKRIRK
jgi:hypothetical protein